MNFQGQEQKQEERKKLTRVEAWSPPEDVRCENVWVGIHYSDEQTYFSVTLRADEKIEDASDLAHLTKNKFINKEEFTQQKKSILDKGWLPNHCVEKMLAPFVSNPEEAIQGLKIGLFIINWLSPDWTLCSYESDMEKDLKMKMNEE